MRELSWTAVKSVVPWLLADLKKYAVHAVVGFHVTKPDTHDDIMDIEVDDAMSIIVYNKDCLITANLKRKTTLFELIHTLSEFATDNDMARYVVMKSIITNVPRGQSRELIGKFDFHVYHLDGVTLQDIANSRFLDISTDLKKALGFEEGKLPF